MGSFPGSLEARDPALAFPAVREDIPLDTSIKSSPAFVLGGYAEHKPHKELLLFRYVQGWGVDNTAAIKVEEAEGRFSANETANEAAIGLLDENLLGSPMVREVQGKH